MQQFVPVELIWTVFALYPAVMNSFSTPPKEKKIVRGKAVLSAECVM